MGYPRIMQQIHTSTGNDIVGVAYSKAVGNAPSIINHGSELFTRTQDKTSPATYCTVLTQES